MASNTDPDSHRVLKLMGDGTLMEFGSVVDAVFFAVEVQRAMAARNADIPKDRQIIYRVGINIGDIIVVGDDIYGDGVNVAARLQSLAKPGGICNMFTVKGVNVFPTGIQSALVKLRPRVTGEFQVVLDRAPPIEYPPVLLVEAAHDLPESRQADLRAEIAASIRRELGFSATVELVRQGTIASEHKTRRVHRIYDGAPDPRTGTQEQKEGWKR